MHHRTTDRERVVSQDLSQISAWWSYASRIRMASARCSGFALKVRSEARVRALHVGWFGMDREHISSLERSAGGRYVEACPCVSAFKCLFTSR